MAVYQTLTREIPAVQTPSAPVRAQAQPQSGLWGGFTVKLTLLLLVVCAAGVTLIRALPYDNGELRALITPPTDCVMPCWNGIQPGIMSVEEAVAALAAHPLVADYRVSPGKISWWWNGDQPNSLDGSGRAFHGRMEYAQVNGLERITSIVLDTTIALGDIQVALGDPDSITLHTVQPQDDSQRAGAVYVAHYDTFAVFAILDCPMNVDDFWQSSTYVAFGSPTFAFEGETFHYDSLPDGFFRDQTPVCIAG